MATTTHAATIDSTVPSPTAAAAATAVVTTSAAVVSVASATPDDITAKTAHKRYENLVTVRTKAIKGKGAWYWVHLEPMLVHNSDTGLAKAVKLRCSLCDAVFSASNPSRTATEHLKRGTCPNFTSGPKPISSIPPSPHASLPSTPSSSQQHNQRKRSASSGGGGTGTGVGSNSGPYQPQPLALIDPRFCHELGYSNNMASAPRTQQQQQHLMLSGGKEDLGALAMLEDSVKKLKSPKASPGPILTKAQIDSALNHLTDWLYESCGGVSFTSIENPKFKDFLTQVGLPPISRKDLAGSRLDSKFDAAKSDSEARIRAAMFFQIASDGWKRENFGLVGGEKLVNLTVNLPHGSSVFHKAVFTNASVPSKYAEEILLETINAISGNVVQRCAGIVSDKFKAKALRNLENQNHWMVNLSCQLQGFYSLIKDFCKELPLFKIVTHNCFKLANFFNTNTQIRSSFHKYKLQEFEHSDLLRVPPFEHAELLRVPPSDFDQVKNFMPVCAMLEDIWNASRPVQMVVLDDSNKMVCAEDPIAREVAEMIRDMGFWNDLEAVNFLVKLIKDMASDIETERPLVGQCLPLWNELRDKVKDWCVKFSIDEGPVENVVEKRFKKNYHPAWAAAFILDPLYLMKDTTGKYLPPFRYLTPEQEKDVDKLITRLVSREEAHIALMELMKWRSEGLDPLYAKAVQMKQPHPMTGKMKTINPQSSRLVWETCLSELKTLGKVAVRLIFLNATSCGFKCNWSFLRWVCAHGHSRAAMDKAQKMIFIAAHAKLGRQDFSSDEDKDAELFATENGDEDMLNKVFVDGSSV